MFRKYLLTFGFLVSTFGCQSSAPVKTDAVNPAGAAQLREISPREAEVAVSRAYPQFVDVRTPEEYYGGHAARAINIPLNEIGKNTARLEKDEPVYLICESGSRSKKAAEVLREAGFKHVVSISGGTEAWRSAGLQMETKAPHRPAEK